MELKDDNNVLQHLLNLEAEAAALVEDAKEEADRRLSDGEKACRAAYDEVYTAEAAVLEAAYIKNVAAIKEENKKQLESYKDTLKSRKIDKAAFSALAERLLIGCRGGASYRGV